MEGEEKRNPTMNRDQILHITYRKCQPPAATAPSHARPEPGGRAAPSASALLRKLHHAELGLEHIFGWELYVAPEGVALPPPEGLDHGRGEAHGTRSGRAPDAEGVGVQVARGNAARRMCPKRARVKYDPSWNANNGPAKVGCVPSNWCNAVKGQSGAGAAEAHGRAPGKGSVFDALMRKLATPRSGSRVRSLYCR